MIQFITSHIRTIGIVYLIIATVVFVAVLLFFWWVCKAEDEERRLYTDDEYYYPDDTDGSAGTAETMCIALMIATGCAILWWGIPLLLIGAYLYGAITRKFPTLAGHTADEEDEREEERQ